MSRAFVKEHEDDEERPPDRPVPPGPNYVTPQGRKQLQVALDEAERAGNERDARYYRERLTSAIVVDPSKQSKGIVKFGATVTARDSRGRDLRVRIVGHDEAEPTRGAISWQSPVAQALADHRVGDRVKVARPAGPIEYRIEAINYE